MVKRLQQQQGLRVGSFLRGGSKIRAWGYMQQSQFTLPATGLLHQTLSSLQHWAQPEGWQRQGTGKV